MVIMVQSQDHVLNLVQQGIGVRFQVLVMVLHSALIRNSN